MRIRPTKTDEDFETFLETTQAAFAMDPQPWDRDGGQLWSALEVDRGLLAVTDDGRAVGTASAYSFELTLPGGGIVPAAGITFVGVLPTHRRQGVLTALMRHQLAEIRERGEFLAVLLASEATIYGRFGYGTATYTRRLTVARRRAETASRGARIANGTTANGITETGSEAAVPQPGTVELLRRQDCVEILEEVYDRYRRAQPGALSRPHRWWAVGTGQPPVSRAPRYIGVHRDAEGVPDGYISYTRGQDGILTVDETVAVDDAAFEALAKFVLGHDRVEQIVFKHLPPEHPLRWQLVDFRAGTVGSEDDWLWLRLLDVPRALTARGWFTDGELVLEVDDPFLGEHDRYLLTVRDGKAECVRTDRSPDLSLDVRDLGSIYLGGTAPSLLVRAGHIRAHRSGAAAEADALFRAERPPHCIHWF